MNQITNKTRFPIDVALLETFEVTLFQKFSLKNRNTKENTIVNVTLFLDFKNSKHHCKTNIKFHTAEFRIACFYLKLVLKFICLENI